MSTIVRWCLARRSVIVFATLLVVGAGAYGATQLRQQYFPEANFPFLVSTVEVPGLDAQQADDDVAVPLETAANNLAEVETTRTVANEGRVQLILQLAYGTNIDDFRTKLQRELDGVALPDGAGPIKSQSGFSDRAVTNVALSTPGSFTHLTDRADDIKKAIEGLPGVQRVDVEGGVVEQFDVALKEKAIKRGTTPQAVASALGPELKSQPIGLVQEGGLSTPLRVQARGVRGVKKLKDTPVANGQTLSDVATVRRRNDPGNGFARTNGRPSISLAVYKEDRADEVAIVDGVDKVLEPVRRELGPSNVTTILETASGVKKAIRGLLIEGALGALFAVLVIFLFLRTLRGTLVAAVSIPTSIVFGLLAGWALGLSLNIITLAGLTIAIGRVIDDAIVVLENIYKHLERGESRTRAATNGTSEVASAIVSSTAATAAVFLPLGLVGGLISEIFFSFSIIVVVALLASLLVSVTVVPVLAATFLRPKAVSSEGREGFLARAVAPVTRAGLRFRWLTMLAALLALGNTIAVVATGGLPTQFLPDSGTQQIYGRADLPAGTGTDRAGRLLRPLERRIKAQGRVRDYQVSFGGAALSLDPNEAGAGANFFATLSPGADVEGAVTRLRTFGTKEFPEGFRVQRVANGPPAGAFEATLKGTRIGDVQRASRRVTRVIKKRPDLVEVRSDATRQQEQYVVRIDKKKLGTEDASRATQALAGLVGEADAGTTTDNTPVVVRVPARLVKSSKALEDLPLPPAAGAAGGASGGPGASTTGAASAGGGSPGGAPGGAGAGAAPGGAPAPGGGPVAGGAAGAGAPATPGAASSAPPGSAQGSGPGATPPAAGATTVGDVGTVVKRTQPAVRSRVDGDNAATISARILATDTNGVNKEIQAQIRDLRLSGVTAEYGGDSKFINQMFRDLALAMVTAIVLVFLVLVVFFGSVGQPITILAPILFSTIGSLLALIVTRQALGLPAMIGQLLLIGIVVANSILLVDTALRLRRQGVERNTALVEAARLRVRPVLMTAVATIAALLPLALGVSGEGGIISQSLGTVVIGGLLTATLLTLVIVPAVFTLFDRGGRPGTPGGTEPPASGNGRGEHPPPVPSTGESRRPAAGQGAPAEA